MSQESCFICEKALPAGQSFYEDHGVKVCLACFRTTKRCLNCRFPSRSLKNIPGFGDVCEFCESSFSKDKPPSVYFHCDCSALVVKLRHNRIKRIKFQRWRWRWRWRVKFGIRMGGRTQCVIRTGYQNMHLRPYKKKRYSIDIYRANKRG